MHEPIVVWAFPSGPNPWTVVLLLEELGVDYKVRSMLFEDTKKEPFISINPNGKVPAIEDPNTDLTLWESGAIVNYLIERYDTGHALSYESLKERHLCNQWLIFHVSGQAPSYSQAAWYNHQHSEKLPSAVERCNVEVHRIMSVLEKNLSREGGQWLVGDKITYADLAFYQWNGLVDFITSNEDKSVMEDYPAVKAWQERMHARPSVDRMNAARKKSLEELNIDPQTGRPREATS